MLENFGTSTYDFKMNLTEKTQFLIDIVRAIRRRKITARLVGIIALGLTIVVPAVSETEQPAQLSVSRSIKETIGKRASELAGVVPPLSVGLVDHILKHARIQRIGRLIVAYNPTHQLFILMNTADNVVTDVRLITVELARRELNPDDQVKAQEGQLGRGFVEGPRLLAFWKNVVEVQNFSNFFDVGLSTYDESSLPVDERAKVEEAIMGPLNSLISKKLAACFSFLDKQDWRRDAALAQLAAIPPDTFETLEPVNFFGTMTEGEVGLLLGDAAVGILYVLVSASVQKDATCKPKSVELIAPF